MLITYNFAFRNIISLELSIIYECFVIQESFLLMVRPEKVESQ